MNCCENLLIQKTAKGGQLIPEHNILYELVTNNKRDSKQLDKT
jgi:hypothetical protein